MVPIRMDASPAVEQDILRSIRRIVRALDLYSRKLVRHFGLSGPQLSCLRLLDLHGPMLSVRGGRLSRQAPPLLQDSISSAVRALAPAEQHNLNRYLHRLDELMTEAGRLAALRGDAKGPKGDTAGPGGAPACSDDKERGQ